VSALLTTADLEQTMRPSAILDERRPRRERPEQPTAPTRPRERRCLDCDEPFVVPRRRGRPPVRCPACRTKPGRNRYAQRPQPGTLVLPGVRLDDPAWAAARRGRRPGNFGRVFAPEPLDSDEVIALLELCDRRWPAGDRDFALYVLLWRTGLRVSEACALELRDIDLRRLRVRVRDSKNGPGTCAMDTRTATVLQRWLDRRADIGITADRALFCTTLDDAHVHGERFRRLKPQAVRNALKRRARKAGIQKNVHPHAFRHTMTDELLDERKPRSVIQAQLRHIHPWSTDAYIRRLRNDELIDAMRDRPWPAEARALLD
jgi:integrase/recombinase XerD